ncbi:MAG: phospholipid scramblase-related protein [Planctomycetota bacterium]
MNSTNEGFFKRNTFLIKERVGVLKMSDTFDIIDPSTQQAIGLAREEISLFMKIMRMAFDKKQLPTTVCIYEGATLNEGSRPLFSLHRGFTVFRAKVALIDDQGRTVATFRRKMLTIGCQFTILDANGQSLGMVKGDWKGWDFKVFDSKEQPIGSVTKKWSGLGRELLTSADSYVVDVSGEPSPDKVRWLLGAGLAIDTVFKEQD